MEEKVKTIGNYTPGEHNASKIVDVDYSAPTVRENHGTVTAIIDDTYKSRDERVYDSAAPSFRAGRSGLKVAEKGAKRLFNIYGEDRGTGYAGNVWGKEYNSPSLTTMGGGNRQPMINEDTAMEDLRIRKLTPRECFRLMAVKDDDISKLDNMSNSTKYHLAGDSIVTTVLMAIFGELLEVEWKGKVNTLHDGN